MLFWKLHYRSNEIYLSTLKACWPPSRTFHFTCLVPWCTHSSTLSTTLLLYCFTNLPSILITLRRISSHTPSFIPYPTFTAFNTISLLSTLLVPCCRPTLLQAGHSEPSTWTFFSLLPSKLLKKHLPSYRSLNIQKSNLIVVLLPKILTWYQAI